MRTTSTLLDNYRNESLAEIVTNRNDVRVIVNSEGELVQKSDPIYLEPLRSGFFGAHFYAPRNGSGDLRLPTLWANILVLWGMSLLLMLALKQETFPKVLRMPATVADRPDPPEFFTGRSLIVVLRSGSCGKAP
jgi:ABC transport system ATP-binding/permease protein